MFKTCEHLVAQMQSAPVAKDGSDAGEAVDPKWENAQGHAHAAARYGVMSRPAPSPTVDPQEHIAPFRRVIDWEAEAQALRAEALARYETKSNDRASGARLINV